MGSNPDSHLRTVQEVFKSPLLSGLLRLQFQAWSSEQPQLTLNSSTHTLVTALPGMLALPTRRQNFLSTREGNLEQSQRRIMSQRSFGAV